MTCHKHVLFCVWCILSCRVRVQGLEKLLGLSAEDAQRVAAAEPALLTFRWVGVTACRIGTSPCSISVMGEYQ